MASYRLGMLLLIAFTCFSVRFEEAANADRLNKAAEHLAPLSTVVASPDVTSIPSPTPTEEPHPTPTSAPMIIDPYQSSLERVFDLDPRGRRLMDCYQELVGEWLKNAFASEQSRAAQAMMPTQDELSLLPGRATGTLTQHVIDRCIEGTFTPEHFPELEEHFEEGLALSISSISNAVVTSFSSEALLVENSVRTEEILLLAQEIDEGGVECRNARRKVIDALALQNVMLREETKALHDKRASGSFSYVLANGDYLNQKINTWFAYVLRATNSLQTALDMVAEVIGQVVSIYEIQVTKDRIYDGVERESRAARHTLSLARARYQEMCR